MRLTALQVIKPALGLAILAILLWVVGSAELIDALAALTWQSIGLLLFVSFVLIYISALKWKLFLLRLGPKNGGAAGGEVSLSRLFRLYLVGYFVNLLMPSYVGGDAVRSYYIGKQVGQHQAAAATILERYTGLAAMLLLALLSLAIAAEVPFEVQLAVVILALGLLAGTAMALSPGCIRVLGVLPGAGVILPHLAKVQAGLILAKQDRGLLLRALVLSLLFHLTTVVNTLAAGAAVGWYGASFLDLTIILPLILLIGAIPISPSGLGLQEGAFVFFLEGVGASPAQALALGLVLRAKSYILALLGWFMWLLEKNAARDVMDAP